MIDIVCIRGDLANLSTKSQSNYFICPSFASRITSIKSPTISPISAQRGGIPPPDEIFVFNEAVAVACEIGKLPHTRGIDLKVPIHFELRYGLDRDHRRGGSVARI
jgi:hypothetical protein